MKKLIFAASACALMVGFSQVHAAGDAAAGKAKAATCAGCHGMDGNSANPLWPKLAGQHAAYLAKSMKAYKSGARNDPMMKPMMATLSDTDIENLAAYFASQKQK